MYSGFKKAAFIVLPLLAFMLILGPPLSYASKLPTVCNIFDKKTADKAGHCKHRSMVSKFQDKSFGLEAIFCPRVDLEINHPIIVEPISPSSLLPSASVMQSNPLRC
jgi:hypothetical protein